MHEYSELFSLLYTSYARNVINVQDKCFLKRNSFLYKQKINALMSQCNPCIYCTPVLIDKNTLLHCKYTIKHTPHILVTEGSILRKCNKEIGPTLPHHNEIIHGVKMVCLVSLHAYAFAQNHGIL